MGELFDFNILLIGFMGAGKSTVADYLKEAYSMEVVEMDQIIAKRQGMSISDIFEKHGEEFFRDLETNLLIEMQSRSNVVISCGGGVPMRERNVKEMKKTDGWFCLRQSRRQFWNVQRMITDARFWKEIKMFLILRN